MTERGGLPDLTGNCFDGRYHLWCGGGHSRALQFHAGFSSWIPSFLPSTVALALSGTLGKSRMVPSGILTNRSLPLTATISPLSIFTSFVGAPLVVAVCDCTCARVDAAKATNRPEATSNTLHLARNLSELIPHCCLALDDRLKLR